MPRVPLIEPVAEPDELRPVFEQLRSTRGRVPGMYRTLAHQPAVLAAHRAYFHAALDTGELPRGFKEKIAFKVARMRGSAYSSGSHRSYALKHGISADTLDAIDRSDYTGLPPDELAALEFAEAMVRTSGHVTDEHFEKLRSHYSPACIVEIVALVGIMELASTLSAAFALDPD
jgi:alkylhydroperoxidase family enzyme